MENEYPRQTLQEFAIIEMQEWIQIQPILILFGRACNFVSSLQYIRIKLCNWTNAGTFCQSKHFPT